MDVSSNNRKIIDKISSFMLQLEDLTSMITFFRKREENIIQLLDSKLKFKEIQTPEATSHLKSLYIQMKEIEESRVEKENHILAKYSNYKIIDDKQKRLIEMFVQKIFHINLKVKEKLIELDLLNETEKSRQDIPIIEETLKDLIQKPEINLELLFTYLTMSSRLRFLKEFQEESQKYQLLHLEVKKTLEDLIHANKWEYQAQSFYDFNWSLRYQNRQNDILVQPNQELISYPLKVSTPIPTFSNKIIANNLESPMNSYKQIDKLVERPSLSPALEQVFPTKKISSGNCIQDPRQKQEIVEKKEYFDREPLYPFKELLVAIRPTFKLAPTTEGGSNRERPKGKRIKRSVFHEKIQKTFELNTQESDNLNSTTTSSKPKNFSCERILKVEAESIKLNYNAIAMNAKQLYQDENKDLYNIKTILNIKRENSTEKQEVSEDSKKYKGYSTQITQTESSPGHRLIDSCVKVINSKSTKNHAKEEILSMEEYKQVRSIKNSLAESSKNYDIMSVEPRPIFFMARMNNKNALIEKLYNELLEANSEIKKTITEYISSLPKENLPEISVENKEYTGISGYDLKPIKPTLKQAMIKSRRSTSTDNANSCRRTSRNLYYKTIKDVKMLNENDPSTTGGSVTQMQSVLTQKSFLVKTQCPKQPQKVIVLPKLGLVDTQKPSEPRDAEMMYLIPNYHIQPFVEKRDSIFAHQASTKKLVTKKTIEKEFEEQRSLLPAGFSIQEFKIQTASKLSKHDLSADNLQDDLNNSGIGIENGSRKAIMQNDGQGENMKYDSFRKKLKNIGSTFIKINKYSELKGRLEKLIEIRRPYATTPEDTRKLSPSKMTTLLQDYNL